MKGTWLTTLGISCILLATALAAPLLNDEEENPELKGGYFEGDIELESTRNGLIAEAKRWPNGIVYYKIDAVFDQSRANHIRRALNTIESVSCIRFRPATANTKAFLQFVGKPTGCHTQVGYRGSVHTLNLQLDSVDKGCFRLGTIMHETLHALGFYHQQSASNRDKYVQIVEANIQDGKEHNFNKYDAKVITDFGIEYDYSSVMHYGAYSFSKNGKATIVALRGLNVELGQRRALTSADIAKLNIMYKCPNKN